MESVWFGLILITNFSFINSVDSDLVQTSSSLPQAHDTRSFRWDPNSGQFSYSQGHHELLQSGVALLQQMSASQPETIAVIQRQYHEKNCVEVHTIPLTIGLLRAPEQWSIRIKLPHWSIGFQLGIDLVTISVRPIGAGGGLQPCLSRIKVV